MRLQAFAFPYVLFRCIPSYVVTKYDIKHFSISLTSLISPSFSVFLCCAIIPERGACDQLLFFAAIPFRKPLVLWCLLTLLSGFYLCGSGEGSPSHEDAPHRYTSESMWEEEMSLVPAFHPSGSRILPCRAPACSLQKAGKN